MHLYQRAFQTEDDFWRIRNFLREIFLLNGRLEHNWNVARLDYWRWHFIATCQVTPPFEKVTAAWQTETGQLAAIVHPFGNGEIRVHIHPYFRTATLEDEIFTYAETHFDKVGRIIVPVFADDVLRREVLTARGYTQRTGWNHHYWRDLTGPLPASFSPAGYTHPLNGRRKRKYRP
jgi:mycothiol synthase